MLSTRVVLGLALGLVPCVSLATPVDRATVVQALSGIDRAPSTSLVQSWGADGERVLREVAVDANTYPFVRARAAHLLRLWPSSQQAHAVLRTLAADTTATPALRRSAMIALVEGFHDVPEVARYLRDPDVLTRDGAVWSLSVSDLPQARQALQSAMSTETTEVIRTGLTAAIRRMDARAARPATTQPTQPTTTQPTTR